MRRVLFKNAKEPVSLSVVDCGDELLKHLKLKLEVVNGLILVEFQRIEQGCHTVLGVLLQNRLEMVETSDRVVDVSLLQRDDEKVLDECALTVFGRYFLNKFIKNFMAEIANKKFASEARFKIFDQGVQ